MDLTMPPARVIRALASNFLSTLISRNSDLDGFWAFGVMLKEGLVSEIDLLGSSSQPATTDDCSAFVTLARARFLDQAAKLKFQRSGLESAMLSMTVVGPPRQELVSAVLRLGCDLSIHVHVAARTRHAEVRRVLFVAPHDPTRELRSSRATR